MPYDVYYDAKPFIPWRLRMAFRRALANRIRRDSQDRWPILESACRQPEGWPGWPGGKQFAFVITHDVESGDGVAKCDALMALERELGFVSSFNFIPQGPYKTPESVRQHIVAAGCEVGVHDLYHDGKLYRAFDRFQRHAATINKYLHAWGATGFRSGFMHHNLDWIHELNVSYDLSTFDTDPFEPQPDGVGTIFPFWVSAPATAGSDSQVSGISPQVSGFRFQVSGLSSQPSAIDSQLSKGYAELPYTLPQDSTLFLLFREAGIDLWKRKLDWVAKHGGMALVNIHPDYIAFDDDRGARRGSQYPVALYRQLLEYVKSRYAGAYWHVLPKEMAEFTAAARVQKPRTPIRVCMITHSDYLVDARVTRYAEALAERGDSVDVLALQRSPETPKVQKVGGVTLHCLRPRFAKREQSRVHYLRSMLGFLGVCARWTAREHNRNPFQFLHVHNIPDFMVFAALYPRLRGAKVILDIHDIVPEFYASKFAKTGRSRGIKLLKIAEKISAKVAHHVIIANDLWLEKYATRTGKNGDCSVFINNVDTRIFYPRPRTRNDGKKIIIFPGGLQWHQGLDIAIRAFAQALVLLGSEAQPSTLNPQPTNGSDPSSLNPQPSTTLEFHIYGDGNVREELVKLADDLGLSQKVKFFKPLPVREVAAIMAQADLGVVPKRADSFGNEAYSTKIMEFMALGVPVIASSTRIDRFYFNESVLRFFPSGDTKALAEAILELLLDDSQREKLRANASQYAAENSWQIRKQDYLALVDALTHGPAQAVIGAAEDSTQSRKAGELSGVC